MSEIGQHVTNQSCTHSDLNIAILGASRTLERNFMNLVHGLTQKLNPRLAHILNYVHTIFLSFTLHSLAHTIH